jgi:hypothetical protein
MEKFLKRIEQTELSFMLEDVETWCSHRPLLCAGLEITKGSSKPILELGCGYGSTPYLNKYTVFDNRKLISLDTNQEWLNTFKDLASDKHELIFKKDCLKWNHETLEWYDSDNDLPLWLDEVSKDGISVCLVDHASGERRHIDIKRLYERCDIMVIHDTEPEATGYLLDKIWHLFKYRFDFNKYGAGATIVSNKYDLSFLQE